MNTKSVFFRLTTDRRRIESGLEQSFVSAAGSACFLIGGGPSLNLLDCQQLEKLPLPRFCINLAGTGKFRPHFWTAYDPSQRFSRSTYLDAGVMKFVHRRRAMDLVPESSWKVCECPNLYFFEGDRDRGFADFLSPFHSTIVDWNDSLVQAIDIAYQLGFRTLYLVGCELKISPSAEMWDFANRKTLEIPTEAGLSEFVQACERQGVSREELQALQPARVYHFEENKSLAASIATDFHYYRVAQFLRLSRCAFSTAGVRLISLTPGSRLQNFFPQQSLAEITADIWKTCGNPAEEKTAGRYSHVESRLPEDAACWRDFMPLHWPKQTVVKTHKNRKKQPVDPPASQATPRPVSRHPREPDEQKYDDQHDFVLTELKQMLDNEPLIQEQD